MELGCGARGVCAGKARRSLRRSMAYDGDVGTLQFDRSGQWRHGVINLHVSRCEYDICLSIRFMIDR